LIKRTIYFSNPCQLKTENLQLVVKFSEEMGKSPHKIPIEDIGVVIIDHAQISIGSALISHLLENNVALITCNQSHHPTGLLLNLDGNKLQSQKFREQLSASLPLKKQLWQQTISSKIANQSDLLHKLGRPHDFMDNLVDKVKSGDPDNTEALAASYYWKHLFDEDFEFTRSRFGHPPNNMLNYGYAILRAIVARSLVGSGLLPTVGIFHRNQYNAYCLADDIMEPYRPFVDALVYQAFRNQGKFIELTPDLKKSILELPAMDVLLDGARSPLMNAVTRTTSSLAKCFAGEYKRILYPKFI